MSGLRVFEQLGRPSVTRPSASHVRDRNPGACGAPSRHEYSSWVVLEHDYGGQKACVGPTEWASQRRPPVTPGLRRPPVTW